MPSHRNRKPCKAVSNPAKECKTCSKLFTPKRKDQIYCSWRCRDKKSDNQVFKIPKHTHPYLHVAAEYLVIADLIRMGHHVFNQVGDASFADFVVASCKTKEVVFIDVKSKAIGFRKKDDTLNLGPWYEKKHHCVWRVYVWGSSIYYPPPLKALLEGMLDDCPEERPEPLPREETVIHPMDGQSSSLSAC